MCMKIIEQVSNIFEGPLYDKISSLPKSIKRKSSFFTISKNLWNKICSELLLECSELKGLRLVQNISCITSNYKTYSKNSGKVLKNGENTI